LGRGDGHCLRLARTLLRLCEGAMNSRHQPLGQPARKPGRPGYARLASTGIQPHGARRLGDAGLDSACAQIATTDLFGVVAKVRAHTL
jgi:hypothetical protein